MFYGSPPNVEEPGILRPEKLVFLASRTTFVVGAPSPRLYPDFPIIEPRPTQLMLFIVATSFLAVLFIQI